MRLTIRNQKQKGMASARWLLAASCVALGLVAFYFSMANQAHSANTAGSGSYVGNGQDNRAITGLGFQPDVILLRSGGTAVPIIRTSTMAGDAAKIAGDLGALQPNLVQSLSSDGFTVGTDARVNESGTTYYWVAMRAGSDLTVGSYTGNGTNNRPITGVGFQPDWLVTLGDGGNSVFRGHARRERLLPAYRLPDAGNRIQALQPDGFQIGWTSMSTRTVRPSTTSPGGRGRTSSREPTPATAPITVPSRGSASSRSSPG